MIKAHSCRANAVIRAGATSLMLSDRSFCRRCRCCNNDEYEHYGYDHDNHYDGDCDDTMTFAMPMTKAKPVDADTDVCCEC